LLRRGEAGLRPRNDVLVLFMEQKKQRWGQAFEKASFPNLPLAHGVGDDRHVRALCACGGMSVVDTAPWIAAGEGGKPLHAFEDRMRCACGARSIPLEIWYGKARPSLQSGIYVFR